MRYAAAFGVVALLPAALNLGPAAYATTISVPVCNGQDNAPALAVPLKQGPPIPDPSSCIKACHADRSRKRPGCHF